MTQARLPTYFLSHGGGPWPWRKAERGSMSDQLEASLHDVRRELGHPSTSKRCFLRSRFGHLRFDVAVDTGPARDVPREAFRRFRADVKTARA